MAKPQVITLPFVLLLWDYWPLGAHAQRNRYQTLHGRIRSPVDELLPGLYWRNFRCSRCAVASAL